MALVYHSPNISGKQPDKYSKLCMHGREFPTLDSEDGDLHSVLFVTYKGDKPAELEFVYADGQVEFVTTTKERARGLWKDLVRQGFEQVHHRPRTFKTWILDKGG